MYSDYVYDSHANDVCCLQESQFCLYALYNKNKPKSDLLMMEYGSTFFKVKYSVNYLPLISSFGLTLCFTQSSYCMVDSNYCLDSISIITIHCSYFI